MFALGIGAGCMRVKRLINLSIAFGAEIQQVSEYNCVLYQALTSWNVEMCEFLFTDLTGLSFDFVVVRTKPIYFIMYVHEMRVQLGVQVLANTSNNILLIIFQSH